MHCTLQLVLSLLALAAFSSPSPIEAPVSANTNPQPESDAVANNEAPAATAPDAFTSGSSLLGWMTPALPAADRAASPSAAMLSIPSWQSAGFLWPMQLLQMQVASASSSASILAAQQLAAMETFGSVAGLQDAIAGFQTIAASLSDASLRAAVVSQIPALQGFHTSIHAQISQIQQTAAAGFTDTSGVDALNGVVTQLRTGGSGWTSAPAAAAASTGTTALWDAVGFFQHLQQLQAISGAVADADAAAAVFRQMQAIAALNSLAGLQRAVRDLMAVEAAVDVTMRRVLSNYIIVLQGFRAAFDAQVQILQQALSTVTDATVARTVSARISAVQFGAASAQDWNSGGAWTHRRGHGGGGYYGDDGYDGRY
ncbi:hypothetical protein HDU83_005098 [Entophlyctis luteolus]|nr:hypothetical protein HDU83_005098 [Entophlyctis luteolus]